MNKFTYSYPTKVYFGEGSAKEALPVELAHIGNTVMLAYGGGSVKKNGASGPERENFCLYLTKVQ